MLVPFSQTFGPTLCSCLPAVRWHRQIFTRVLLKSLESYCDHLESLTCFATADCYAPRRTSSCSRALFLARLACGSMHAARRLPAASSAAPSAPASPDAPLNCSDSVLIHKVHKPFLFIVPLCFILPSSLASHIHIVVHTVEYFHTASYIFILLFYSIHLNHYHLSKSNV